jgi:hypothetical protein
MKNKSKLLLVGLSLLFLTSCGYDGSYRYPCQDPANWEKAECKPPLCTVNKTCPEDLNSNVKDITKGTTNG